MSTIFYIKFFTLDYFVFQFFFTLLDSLPSFTFIYYLKKKTRGDNTVSVAQGGIAAPGATKQLLPPDRVLKELYIYIYIYIYNAPDQLRAETTLDVNLHIYIYIYREK